MTDLLSTSVRVDREAERLYFFDGAVSVDVNGDAEKRKAVLAFLAQAQAMARQLGEVASSNGFAATHTAFLCDVRTTLVAAGVSLTPKKDAGP